MGKFGIGARVRDIDGDIAEVIGKSKGFREVRYSGGKHDGMVLEWRKSSLEPANDNSSISAETSENAYSGGDDKPVSAWMPKVGDRVRFKVDNPNGGATYGKAGEEFVVTSTDSYPWGSYGPQVDIDHPGHDFKPSAPISALEPVVAPATTWKPKVGERVRHSLGDAYVRAADSSILIEFDEPNAYTHSAYGKYQVLLKRDGCAYFVGADEIHSLPATAPFTIEAGKFYRTRDGRKVGPVEARNSTWTDYPWVGTVVGKPYRYIWKDNGENYDGPGSDHDLVAEWVEPAQPEVAVAEETATPARKFKVGDVVNYAYEGRQQTSWQGVAITKDDGTLYHATCPENGEGAFYEEWLTPAATPAKFKVGDRVVIAGGPYLSDEALPGQTGRIVFGATLGLRGDWQVELKGGLTLGFNRDEIELATEPSIPIGATVTFTATGRLSAYTTDGHAQIVFPGLTPGQNSFALPAAFGTLAN